MPSFEDVPTAVLREIVDECNGHYMYAPAWLLEKGVDPELVRSVTKMYTSDGTHQGSIWDDGSELVPAAEGIFVDDLMPRICEDLGLDAGTPYLNADNVVQELRERVYRWLAA